MKRRHFPTDFSVGFVLFVATVIVITSLFFVGDGKNFVAARVDYIVRLPSAGGLKSGSHVLLGGVQAGSVTHIEFAQNLNSSDVLATISLEKAYRERIREDSYASIESQGLLGDSVIHVKLGTAEKPVLPAGSTIRFKPRAMIDTFAGEEISESTGDLIRMITSVLGDISKGQGTLGQLLKNPDLYDNLNAFTKSMALLTQQIESISKELDVVLDELKGQKGALGQLIFSEEYAKTLSKATSDAGALIASLRVVAESVEKGEGAVGKLVRDSSLHDSARKAIDDVARAAARIDSVLARAEDSQSVLGRLAVDGGLGKKLDLLVERLERTAGSLERIAAKVDRGEGSVGMLVNDPSIAVSLRDLFHGVSEMSVVQNVVRNAERDGRDAYLRDQSLARREAEEVLRLRALRNLRGAPPDETGKPVPAAASDESKEK